MNGALPVIIQGDARAMGLADESVDCVVTSPPYWGLRAYAGLEPSVFGGDPACEHEWGDDLPGDPRGGSGPNAKECYGGNDGKTTYARQVARGQFCRKCNAWRGHLGLEPTPDLFVEHMVAVFREVWRVLRDDGTLWLNLGDSYAGNHTTYSGSDSKWQHNRGNNRKEAGKVLTAPGLKPKDLCGIPWRVALALQADGWWLRSDIVWNKPNPMPESVTDRPARCHEYIFLLTKSERYFYDAEAIKEAASPNTHARYGRGRSDTHKYADGGPGNQTIAKSFDHMRPAGVNPKSAQNAYGSRQNASFSHTVKDVVGTRNKRSVWTIPTAPFPEAHFATFPPKLVEPCIMAGTSERGNCPTCGLPWVRVVEKSYENPGNRTTNGPRSKDRKHIEHGSAGYDVRKECRSTTLGWRPVCECYSELWEDLFAVMPKPRNARKRQQRLAWYGWRFRSTQYAVCSGLLDTWPARPAVVLDPFAGSGTTPMVAHRLGRHGIGNKASAEYCRMARDRILKDVGEAPEVVEVGGRRGEQRTIFDAIKEGAAG